MKKKHKKGNEFIKYIFKQIKNFHKLEVVSVFLTIGFSVSVIATPYLTRYLIDLFAKNMEFSDIWFILIAFLIACILQPIFAYLNTKIIKKIAETIILKVRCMLFNNIIKAPFSFFYKNSSGSIISRLVNDSNQMGSFLSNSITILFQNFLFIFLILIGMSLLSKFITFLLCILLSFYVAFNLFLNKKFEEKSGKVLENNDDLYKIIKQGLDNIESIKTMQQEESHYSKFLYYAKRLYTNKLKLYNLYNIVDSINGTIEVLSISLIYIVGFFLTSKGKLTIGSVVAFDVYFQMIIPSIKILINFNSNYHEVVPMLSRLEEYFNIKQETPMTSCKFSNHSPSICFDKVTFKYDTDYQSRTILDSFSLKMDSNGLHGLVGQSGTGKSTIAKLMVGLYQPLKGNIMIDFGEETISNVRDNIGYASQNMKLFYNTTIRYNMTLGNNSISNEEIRYICDKLNLNDKISKLPNGYEELVTEMTNLSFGEVQRIILARIYLQRKPINILDEITSSLDYSNTQLAKDVINELSKKSLVVLLTHNLDLLDGAKQFIRL